MMREDKIEALRDGKKDTGVEKWRMGREVIERQAALWSSAVLFKRVKERLLTD